jgi:hypothetical protein
MAYDTHADVQNLLADVRAWVPVVVEVDGEEYRITGLRIEHENQENVGAPARVEMVQGVPNVVTPDVGAQVKAVLETTIDSPTIPTHLGEQA